MRSRPQKCYTHLLASLLLVINGLVWVRRSWVAVSEVKAASGSGPKGATYSNGRTARRALNTEEDTGESVRKWRGAGVAMAMASAERERNQVSAKDRHIGETKREKKRLAEEKNAPTRTTHRK